MNKFYGTKLIAAKPMTRAEYNAFRGWELPNNENGGDEGYLVEYLDGGKPNVEGYAGYVSWSPKEQFENAYQPTDAMSFGHAILAARAGAKIARAGWNGKNMFVALMPALKLPPFNSQEPGAKVNDRTAKFIGEDTPLDSQPYFAMKTATGAWQPGWLASQNDMLANDWQIVD
ncbi:MAG: DUF2829 domain-containing protein [Candidatus Brocadia sp. WS118]|nr:MAG: DUF2829 domain-containing protein [Candidatus Brocadia sp. WS118]